MSGKATHADITLGYMIKLSQSKYTANIEQFAKHFATYSFAPGKFPFANGPLTFNETLGLRFIINPLLAFSGMSNRCQTGVYCEQTHCYQIVSCGHK